MTHMRLVKPAGAIAAVALIVFAANSFMSPRVHADSSESDSRVQIGLAIAPVKLNLSGKNLALVGKGSYIVNTQLCNNCHHSDDIDHGSIYAPGHNPYFGQSTAINPDSYLGGGHDFGQYPFPTPVGAYPHIFGRNLTPDVSGLPEGGTTLQQFFAIMRTGHDFDGLHPTCGPSGPNGTCLPPPYVGDLLQIMPWPIFAKMSDEDLTAIYEYLKAIPCISHKGTVGLPANVYQTCPAP